MSLRKLYEYIKPLVDIYFYKYFGEKKTFVFDMITKLNEKASLSSNDEIKNCEFIYKIFYFAIFITFIVLIIWTLYDTWIKNYKSISYKLSPIIKNQLRLKDLAEFKQIENVIYFTDNFSIDFDLFIYTLIICVILYIVYYFHVKLEIDIVLKEFNLMVPILVIILILGIIYFIYNYTFINLLSRRNHSLKDVIYKNINIEFLNKYNICNYIQKKDKYDDYFQYGKCNDIKYNFSKNRLYDYINDVINEIYNKNNSLTLENFKTMKDKNGILYKDKLSSAFFTFILIKYFVDNNLLDDAKELLSTYNLFSFINRINPILSLNYESLIFSSSDVLNFESPKMRKVFNNNKDIYNYVYNEFYNNNSQVQELIIDIYNVCKYKIISIYDYYLFVGLIIICTIIYYFIKYYYKN